MQSRPEFVQARFETTAAQGRLAAMAPFERPLGLEKSWHILHYVFTGETGPVESAGDALMNGEDVGDDFAGYGPPRILDPGATAAFSDFLKNLSVEELQERVDYERMISFRIYGLPMGGGDKSDFERELRGELTSYFPKLRDYVSAMSEKRNGLLLWLT